jgi:8-oxo-dGTP pyrophosphatase MutT (NUDIX family)
MSDFSRVAVRNQEGKFLLIHTTKKGRNRWEFPGGKRDSGETFRKTAIRELQEETGLNPYEVSFVKTIPNLMLDDDIWNGYFFLCTKFGGVPRILEPDKADRLGWFSVDEMKILPTIPLLSIEIARELEILDISQVEKFWETWKKSWTDKNWHPAPFVFEFAEAYHAHMCMKNQGEKNA